MTDAAFDDHYEGIASRREALIRLFDGARLGVQAVLERLDPRIWNREDLCDALRAAVLRHERFEARLCLLDADGVRRENPRLAALVDRLPSRISVRIADPQDADMPEHFVLVDERRYLRRPTPVHDRWLTHATPPNEAPRLAAAFDDVWERASPHPDMRTLRL